MVRVKRHRELKHYQDDDMIAAFGADLWLGGCTSVPNLLLRYYRFLGITDSEMILLIHLLRMRTEEQTIFANPEQLTEYMHSNIEEIKNDLNALLEKEFLTVVQYFDVELNQVVNGYDFTPLFKRLGGVWASAKLEESIGDRPFAAGEESGPSDVEKQNALLFNAFEKEFGRTFTPIEIEQIVKWSQATPYNLVMEALRQAVLRGKHNLKYIDSILREWEKNNLRTLDEINEYNQRFRGRGKGRPVKAAGTKDREDAEDKKKKDLIKTIYVS